MKSLMNTKRTIIVASMVICLLLIGLLYMDQKVRKLESQIKGDTLEKEVVLTNITAQQTPQAAEPPGETTGTQTTEEQAPKTTEPKYTGPIGILKVVSKPAATVGAKVYLNGTYFGVTPYMNSSVPVGDYVVSLTKTGYIEYKKKVTIFPFKQRDVIALLITTAQQAAQQNDTDTNATEEEEDEEVPEGEGILFKSEPTGAEVKIGGVNKGTTPVKIKLTEGEYVVKMSKSGYAQYMVFMEISDIGTIKSISDEDGGASTMGDTLFIVEFG